MKDAPIPLAPPPGRRDRTRASLIRAAETLMASRSMDAVAIDDIVEAAGVAKGTFYNHFPDKGALQHAILELIRLEIRQAITQRNGEIDDPARRVSRAFCATIRYALEHRTRGDFLTRTSMAFLLMDDPMNRGLVQDIAAGLGSRRFLIATSECGALLVMGVTHAALVQSLAHGDAFAIAARAQQLGAMILRGLGLPHDEADQIAAREVDHILCNHTAEAAPDAAVRAVR